MNETRITNNQVTVAGTVISKEMKFSHEVFGERFYIFDLAIQRLSEQKDIIPIMISDKLLMFSEIKENSRIRIEGHYRSYNQHEEEKNRLILTVLAKEIYWMDEDDVDENHIILDGFLCKPVIYRKTPLGKRISEMIIAVNRSYGKSDYIPCIAWGRDAIKSAVFTVGDKVILDGRIQSRIYYKQIEKEQMEERTAYEVSISKMDLVS